MLNGKKKVSFSMLLDRISSVILCADEAKSIYRILSYPFDTLRLHTRVELWEEFMAFLELFFSHKCSTNHFASLF